MLSGFWLYVINDYFLNLGQIYFSDFQVFDENDQMNQALAQPVGDLFDVAESDLEDELAEILKVNPDAMSRDKANLSDLSLPDVPEHEPAFNSSIPARSTVRAKGPVLHDE